MVSCYIHHDKRFAFVEFRTVEEASNSIALDGVGYRNEILRVSTPRSSVPCLILESRQLLCRLKTDEAVKLVFMPAVCLCRSRRDISRCCI